MKILAYALIALSVVLAIKAIGDQRSGHAWVMGRSFAPNIEDRQTDPVSFHNLMTYQWLRAALPGLAGFFLLYLIRRSDKLDILSPHFQGKAAADELSDYLDREEKERQKSKK